MIVVFPDHTLLLFMAVIRNIAPPDCHIVGIWIHGIAIQLGYLGLADSRNMVPPDSHTDRLTWVLSENMNIGGSRWGIMISE